MPFKFQFIYFLIFKVIILSLSIILIILNAYYFIFNKNSILNNFFNQYKYLFFYFTNIII